MPPVPTSYRLEMMGADREQKDDRNRYADQPQHDGTHEIRLRGHTHPTPRMNRLRSGSLVQDRGRRGFGMMLAPAEHCRAEHHCGGVENYNDDEPTQRLNRH